MSYKVEFNTSAKGRVRWRMMREEGGKPVVNNMTPYSDEDAAAAAFNEMQSLIVAPYRRQVEGLQAENRSITQRRDALQTKVYDLQGDLDKVPKARRKAWWKGALVGSVVAGVVCVLGSPWLLT